MHTEYVKATKRHEGYPIEVADEGDFTCDCGKIVDGDDSVMCELCEKHFCPDCIATKYTSDHKVCFGCFDEMISERLSRED